MKNKAPVFSDRAPVVDLTDRMAGMSDASLDTLHANAARLLQNGNERQRASAASLMPAIEAELSARHSKLLAGSARSRRDAEKRSERFAANLAAVKTAAVPPIHREPSGPAHKFGLGQEVKLFRTLHGAVIDSLIYEVVRQLPLESTEFQYRIRSKDGRVERIVLESQLGAPPNQLGALRS
jgi:hypothetical protein